MKYLNKRLDIAKFTLLRYCIFLQATRKMLAEESLLWLLALLCSNDHDETPASNAYARHGGRKSTADCRKAGEDDERERTRSGGLASGVSFKRKYEYDAMGQLLKVFDAEENETSVAYDLLGRKVELQNKDSGRRTFVYDELKLLYESNSVLDKSGKRIDYTYDGFGRVTKITYPVGGTVEYKYGMPSDTPKERKAVGKILSVSDASGINRFEYGKLGETTREERTLNRHDGSSEKTMTATMEYKSDYLGRMQHIVYPDGEKIYYEYDEGGQVVSVKGDKDGTKYTYVSDIGYDEYSQRTYIKYGNGVETHYEYDREMRWLELIATKNGRGVQLQNMHYTFDDVGNITQYINDCFTKPNEQGVSGRYKTKQTYSYDGLYQLTSVTGDAVNDDYASSSLGSATYDGEYTQKFSFDAIGNMKRKVSSESVKSGRRIGDGLTYSFDYVYDENFAHRLKRAGNEQNGYRHFSYDANGNVIEEKDTISANPNEETSGLLPATMSVTSNSAGEKVYKSDYAWGYFKDAPTGSNYGGSYKRTYEWDSRNLLIASSDNTHQVYYTYDANGERTNKYTHRSETLYFNTFWNWHRDSAISNGQFSKNIYLGTTRLVTKLHNRLNELPAEQSRTDNCYYYHSDHLGSAQLITDYKGNEYQRLEYTPYGELWIEKTSSAISAKYLPYKFTGKERDEETGLYYFGARYLDPKYSRWLSADPALGEYIPLAPIDDEAKKHNSQLPGQGGIYNHINLQLYHYSNNNPVKYIDPDGKAVTNDTDDYIVAKTEKTITLKDGTTTDTVVLAPGDTFIGNVDGTRDKDGNYTKISGMDINKIDYTVKKENEIEFDNKKSEIQNSIGDKLKQIKDFSKPKKEKDILSGSYKKDSESGKFLEKDWGKKFKKDLGENFNDYEKAYQSEKQKKIREEFVIKKSGEE